MTISTLNRKSIMTLLDDVQSLHDEFVWVRLLHLDVDIKIDSDDIRAEGGVYPYLEDVIRNADATEDVIEYALEEVTNHDFILVDWEGTLTSLCCDQYGFDDALFEQLMDACEDYDEEVVTACYELFNDLSGLEHYCGEFEDDEAFAYDYMESTGMLEEVPESLRRYFDFEAFGRDLDMSGDITSHNGHYFWNH